MPCQFTQSIYATDCNAIMYIRGSTQSTAIFEVSSAQVCIYTYILYSLYSGYIVVVKFYISYIQAIVVVKYLGFAII